MSDMLLLAAQDGAMKTQQAKFVENDYDGKP